MSSLVTKIKKSDPSLLDASCSRPHHGSLPSYFYSPDCPISQALLVLGTRTRRANRREDADRGLMMLSGLESCWVDPGQNQSVSCGRKKLVNLDLTHQ